MFRTVVIRHSSKLQYLQGYMIIYDGEKEKRVYLTDVSVVVIESTGTLITMPLLIELIKHKIAVIFCDEKHNPIGNILSLNANYQLSANLRKQISWDETRKGLAWKEIITLKVSMQVKVLKMFEKEKTELIQSYIIGIDNHDTTNREGLAAKVYFFEMFGHEFNRNEETVINGILDYGYAMILSCFNREITAAGYLPQLGIHHIGRTNPFNLSCDLMEPFRPLVDIIAFLSIGKEEPIKDIRKLMTKKIYINKEERYIDDAIGVYVNNLLRYLSGEINQVPEISLLEKGHYMCNESNENDSNV